MFFVCIFWLTLVNKLLEYYMHAKLGWSEGIMNCKSKKDVKHEETGYPDSKGRFDDISQLQMKVRW